MRSFSPWPDPPIIKPPNASVEWEPHAHSGRSRMSRKPNTPRYRGGRGSSHPGGRGLGRGGGNRPGGIRPPGTGSKGCAFSPIVAVPIAALILALVRVFT